MESQSSALSVAGLSVEGSSVAGSSVEGKLAPVVLEHDDDASKAGEQEEQEGVETDDVCDSDSSSNSSSLTGAVHPARKEQMMHAIIDEQNREIGFLRQHAETHIARRKKLLLAVAKFLDNQAFTTKGHGLGELFMAFCDA